jgi:hypothetical protein
MKQDSILTLSKIWQTLTNIVLAVGIFLLFFLGAKALAQLTDSSQVIGRPRQHVNKAGMGLSSFLPISYVVEDTTLDVSSSDAGGQAADATPQTAPNKGRATKAENISATENTSSTGGKTETAADPAPQNKSSGR